jgi:hypothetical protein
MFGKPEWFRPKSRGWGLRPTTWQGWVYALAWSGVIAIPFCTLIARQLVPEAVVWLLAAAGVLVWDVRQLLGGIRHRRVSSEIQFLDDSQHGKSTLDTQGFRMRIRR